MIRRSAVRLISPISAARVVDLPELVVPERMTTPDGASAQRRRMGGRLSDSSVGTSLLT